MGALTKRKWASIALLSVVLPIGLLITFRLTGILPEPQKPETVQMDPVTWEMKRPSVSVLNIGERVEDAYANGEVAVGIGVNVAWYVENPEPSVGPFFGRDGLFLLVYVNVSVLQGSGVSLSVRYLPDENTTIYIETNSMIQSNVSVTNVKWFGIKESEAYCRAKILNSPSYMNTQANWVFNDPNNEDHQLNLVLEITYLNRTTYKTIVLPVILQMLISTT